MNIFIVLIACFTQIYADNQCFLEDPNNECCLKAVNKIQRFMNISGVIAFSKQKFVFEPTRDWAIFAKKIIESKESERLKDMHPRDVDEILKRQKWITPLTILYIKAQASGHNLLTHDSLDWHFSNAGVLQGASGIFHLKKGTTPILESKKAGLRFHFDIGPKFWEADKVSREICAEFGKSKECFVRLGDPLLEIEKNKSYQRITYGIFVYHGEVKGRPIALDTPGKKTKPTKVSNLIRGVAEVLVDRIQKMKTKEHLGLPYRYSLKQELIHMQDSNILFYIRRWIQTKDCTHVTVNLYELMKAYLKNSHITSIYEGVPHSPQEFKAQDSEQHILFVDKFSHSDDLSGFGKKFVPKGTEDQKMLQVLEERLNTISDKVKNQDLNDKEAPKMKDFILRLIKEDFKKFRPSRDLKYQYLPGETYFAGREDNDYKPSYRKLGPPYGNVKTPRFFNQKYHEESETSDCLEEEEPADCPNKETFPEDCGPETIIPKPSDYPEIEEPSDCSNEETSPEDDDSGYPIIPEPTDCPETEEPTTEFEPTDCPSEETSPEDDGRGYPIITDPTDCPETEEPTTEFEPTDCPSEETSEEDDESGYPIIPESADCPDIEEPIDCPNEETFPEDDKPGYEMNPKPSDYPEIEEPTTEFEPTDCPDKEKPTTEKCESEDEISFTPRHSWNFNKRDLIGKGNRHIQGLKEHN